MTLAHNAALIGIELCAASVWIGSLVCLVLVAGAARSALGPSDQVDCFSRPWPPLRHRRQYRFGHGDRRRAGHPVAPSWWGRLEDTTVALAGFLVALTALGVRQARSMIRLRRLSLETPTDHQLAVKVRHGAKAAAVLRAIIAAASFAIVAVVAVMVGH